MPARSEGVGSPLAVRWFSVPRGREPDRPGPQGLGGQRAHRRGVLGGGGFESGGSLPHDVEAERTVRKLGAEVDVVGTPLHRGEILAEALP